MCFFVPLLNITVSELSPLPCLNTPPSPCLPVLVWANSRRARWDRVCYSDGWNTLAQNKHLLHIAAGAHALFGWLNKRTCMSGRFGFFSAFDGKERIPAARPYLKASLATSCTDPAGTETPRERRKELWPFIYLDMKGHIILPFSPQMLSF